jgi:CheY-like chemotaxis protein
MAKILNVDDERNIRKNLASFFESCGNRVRTAASAADALATLAYEGGFDVVLADYRMAEINR